jgi:hypothetical protein
MQSPSDLGRSRLDEWRFNKHVPSRAAALRELLKTRLATKDFEIASKDHPLRRITVLSTRPARVARGRRSLSVGHSAAIRATRLARR